MSFACILLVSALNGDEWAEPFGISWCMTRNCYVSLVHNECKMNNWIKKVWLQGKGWIEGNRLKVVQSWVLKMRKSRKSESPWKAWSRLILAPLNSTDDSTSKICTKHSWVSLDSEMTGESDERLHRLVQTNVKTFYIKYTSCGSITGVSGRFLRS